jgi:hypothetical protein
LNDVVMGIGKPLNLPKFQELPNEAVRIPTSGPASRVTAGNPRTLVRLDCRGTPPTRRAAANGVMWDSERLEHMPARRLRKTLNAEFRQRKVFLSKRQCDLKRQLARSS